MDTQNIYENSKKRMRELFLISLKNDFDKWYRKRNEKNDFYSPAYGTCNADSIKLNIDNDKHRIFICKPDETDYVHIKRYKLFFIPLDKEINKYAKLLKSKFKHNTEIEKMKKAINNLENTFVKEVRKEKLDNINNS